MKKILFLARCLEGGGISKSIINLLNTIDSKKYEVHLFIMFDRKTELEKLIPDSIIIHKNKVCNYLLSHYHGSAESIKQKASPNDEKSIVSLVKSKLGLIDKAYAALLLAVLCPSIGGEYDTIVDYYGQTQLYYMVEKLKAKKKVTFFHNDYNQFKTYYRTDKYYFRKVDKIYTISKTCVESIKKLFPSVEDKVFLMENITSPSVINHLASEPVTVPMHDGVLLVTVGHACFRKGTDFIIDAACILKKKGIKFYWMIVGSVGEEDYESIIKDRKIDDCLRLYGETNNPYPLMNCADIIVHPSRFEGKTIVIDEAKILCKPIVATNFSTVGDQLENNVNGLICDMNSDSLADAVLDLICDPIKRQRFSTYLKSHIRDNSSEVEKLYSIFDI